MKADPIDSGAVDWIYDGRLAQAGYSVSELNTLARVLSRACPHCEAPPGQYCHTGNGQQITHLDNQHLSRRMPREH